MRRVCVTGWRKPRYVRSAKSASTIMNLDHLESAYLVIAMTAIRLLFRVAFIGFYAVFHHLEELAMIKDYVCIEHNL